jgi:hypothetical protein
MPGGRPATIVTQRDVETLYGAKAVRDMFDDRRVGQADPSRLEGDGHRDGHVLGRFLAGADD